MSKVHPLEAVVEAMTQPVKKWNFRPHPLVKNPYLQSVVGIHWPTGVPDYQAKQHTVALDDGDQLVLHEDVLADATEDAPIVLLIHGLAGSHMSTYMSRNAHHFSQRGYRVFRMDMRGCGAGEKLAKRPTHCGRSDDVAAALYHIAELFPETETSIVAYSMSGTLTLNMLAEAGEMPIGNLQRSFVVSPPTDLAHVERYFSTFWGRKFDKFFVKLIWSQIQRRWEHFPELALDPIPMIPKRLRDIDEMVIAPSGGFTSADDYYEKTSPVTKLKEIKQPVTILFAEDDPVVPIGPLLAASRSSSVELITTKHGGHLGFLGSRNEDPDFRWLDWRVFDWLEEGQAKPEAKQQVQQTEVHV